MFVSGPAPLWAGYSLFLERIALYVLPFSGPFCCLALGLAYFLVYFYFVWVRAVLYLRTRCTQVLYALRKYIALPRPLRVRGLRGCVCLLFRFPGGSRAALDFLEFMRILFLPRTCARLRVCPRNLGLVRSGLGGPRGFFFFLIMHFSPSFFEKCATCRLVFQSSGQTRSRGP